MLTKLKAIYEKWLVCTGILASFFLLLTRINWGWQFVVTGKGKLANPGQVIEFFQSLGIPFPAFNVYLVGLTEFLGGLFLILGLGSRIITIPLAVTMFVAYLTADQAAFFSFFSDTEAFVKATPFPFLITVLTVLFFGAGTFSIDRLIGKFVSRKPCSCPPEKT
ncbi:MAG: DoxX family protein [Deltaproteobacteria bacterium]|nr:DoxX family protein [Deltaproteobacteria bacterium]